MALAIIPFSDDMREECIQRAQKLVFDMLNFENIARGSVRSRRNTWFYRVGRTPYEREKGF